MRKVYRAFRLSYCKRLFLDNRYNRVRKKLRKQQKISVAFILVNADTWKLGELYKELSINNRFTPIIIIAPFTSKGDTFLKEQMNLCIQLCEAHKYEYLAGYDLDSDQSIDVTENASFDIVFFTNPNTLTSKEYLIGNYKNSLNCYVPYSFRIDNLYSYDFDNRLVNLTWMNFWETEYHKTLSEQYASNNGKNVKVTGYPQLDFFIKRKTNLSTNRALRKKIIWAPHWTIRGMQNTGLDWSCFLTFQSDFLSLADKWRKEIEIVLKPHPFLFNLLEDTCWGKERVADYKNEWIRRENCSILYGNYSDLFLMSDALIHDSGSFLVEYLALDRPAAYMLSTDDYSDRFNAIGKDAIASHYKIRERIDLNIFLESVVKGEDYGVEERAVFQKKYMNYGFACEKIVSALSESI